VALIHLLSKLVSRTSDPILSNPLILPGNPVSATAGIIRHQRTFGLNQNHLPNRLKTLAWRWGFTFYKDYFHAKAQRFRKERKKYLRLMNLNLASWR